MSTSWLLAMAAAGLFWLLGLLVALRKAPPDTSDASLSHSPPAESNQLVIENAVVSNSLFVGGSLDARSQVQRKTAVVVAWSISPLIAMLVVAVAYWGFPPTHEAAQPSPGKPVAEAVPTTSPVTVPEPPVIPSPEPVTPKTCRQEDREFCSKRYGFAKPLRARCLMERGC